MCAIFYIRLNIPWVRVEGFGSGVEILHSPDVQTEVTKDSEVLEGAQKDKGEEKVYKHDFGVTRKRRLVA